MDTTSSSTSMAVSNHRDAPSSAAEDDGSLSVTSGLAKEAASLFQSGKFADCCRVLHQLLQKKEGDPKVLHNIAVAENFQDGCSNPKKLIEELNNAKKRSEELACAAREQAEPASIAGTKAVSGVNGNNSVPRQLSGQLSSNLVYTDEFDPSVTLYNLAVCWFHLHEHAKAFSILEGLFQNIEPIDEEIAKRICILLLDVALLTQKAARSADVISYVEKVFCTSSLLTQVDSGNSGQLTASTVVVKSASFPSNSTIPDASNPDLPAAGITSEGSLSRTLSEEGLEDDALHLISSMEIGGQNLPRQSGMKSSNDPIRSQADESITTADMRIKLHLCKVRFLLLTRNLKAAKREVKMAMNTARSKDHSMALYLKSQLEYARGNHRKAIKLLMASSNRTEIGISSIYYNNLGCIYYRLGKHHTASVLFAKALSSSSALRKERPLKLSTISQDKSLLITYNCGVQYLACGKPLQAASCFYKASQVFYERPLLWLRTAECCLMALEQGLLKSSSDASGRSEVKVHVVGKGKWRQLVLEDGILGNGQGSFSGAKDLAINDRQPKLSVSLARQCLLNALHLLNCSESKGNKSAQVHASALEEGETKEAVPSKTANCKNGSAGDPKAVNVSASGQVNANGEVKEQKGSSSQNASLSSSLCEYEATCKKENLMIEQAVLADLAFVELELGNPLKALTIAKSLLNVQECSRIYIFLGNVYAAEALCLLNRPKEAAEHLSTYISSGKGVDLPFSQEDSEMWRQEKPLDSEDTNSGSATLKSFPSEESQAFLFLKPEEARGILFANLAAMSAMQGDIEQAQNYAVQALSTKPQRPEAILTAVYVDLLRGRVQEALTKLKHCSCVRFLPDSATLNGSSR